MASIDFGKSEGKMPLPFNPFTDSNGDTAPCRKQLHPGGPPRNYHREWSDCIKKTILKNQSLLHANVMKKSKEKIPATMVQYFSIFTIRLQPCKK